MFGSRSPTIPVYVWGGAPPRGQQSRSPSLPQASDAEVGRGKGAGGPGGTSIPPRGCPATASIGFAAPGAPTPPGHLRCWPEPQWDPDPTCHLRGPWEKGMPRRQGRSHTVASGGPEPHAVQQVPRGPPPLPRAAHPCPSGWTTRCPRASRGGKHLPGLAQPLKDELCHPLEPAAALAEAGDGSRAPLSLTHMG